MLLLNPSFEGGYTRQTHTGQEFGEIFVPEGWTAFWREDKVEYIYRPEMKIIKAEAPFLDPLRISEGSQALQYFKQWGKLDAGIYQTVTVPDSIIRLGAWCHAWYSQRDNPHKSEYINGTGEWITIHNGDPGVTFWLGVDPDGGTDPWADSVGWAQVHHYDAYKHFELMLPARGEITVFLRATNDHRFKHVDMYWDDVTLDIVPVNGGGECRGLPRVQYARTYYLLPQNATREQLAQVQDIAYPDRATVGFSADDAGLGDLDSKTARPVWFSENSWGNGAIEAFFAEYYPGTKVDSLYLFDEPDPEPPPDFTPESFTPMGTKAGFHGSMGDQGQVNIYEFGYLNGVVPPTGKLVAAWGAAEIMRDCGGGYIVGRAIDRPGVGNLEWFDSNRDPVVQAEMRMGALLPIMQSYPAVDYWEIINEQNPPEAADHAAMALFFIRAMEIAEANGIKLACFSHSVGTPKAGLNGEPDHWQAIADTGVFELMAAGGHILSLHEYGQVPDDLGSVMCRYRRVYNRHILPRRLNIPLIITEYGVTRDHIDDHDFVKAQLMAYDAEVRKDPYVVGFQCYIGPIGDEQYYDAYTDIQEPWYVDYMIAEKDKQNG